ncbi:MAG TPA: hypothetical protein VKZ78_04580 [Sphingobacteriaceae bacterium]|nr:hypothetical protein [Sphingobacteriaceae bacterium]
MKNIVVIGEKNLLWVILVMVLPMLGACQKQEINDDELKCPVTAIEGPDDNILGKWKLVKTRTSAFNPPSKIEDQRSRIEDYSCNNIIYHFKEDGLLIVSGTYEGVFGFTNGEYSFVFSNTPSSDGMEDKFKLTLKIEQRDVPCSINNNNMIIDYAPGDGHTHYFVRVE